MANPGLQPVAYQNGSCYHKPYLGAAVCLLKTQGHVNAGWRFCPDDEGLCM